MRKPRTTTFGIDLDQIQIPPERLRQLQPDVVEMIATSIQERRIQFHPITVRPLEDENPEQQYELIDGLHRLFAMRKLRRKEIRATVVTDFLEFTMDPEEIRKRNRPIEIDANLCGADLSPAERARHLALWKEEWESRHPAKKQGGGPGNKTKGGRGGRLARQIGAPTFTEDAAKKTGLGKRSVQRAVEHGKKVVVIKEIAGTCLDKEGELAALAKLPPEEQQALANRARAGEQVTARPQEQRPPAEAISRCSFCDRDQTETQIIRTRKKAAICVECVEECVGDLPEKALDRIRKSLAQAAQEVSNNDPGEPPSFLLRGPDGSAP